MQARSKPAVLKKFFKPNPFAVWLTKVFLYEKEKLTKNKK